ncbi:MAG: SprB repeat-containing protein [Cyclobacteriaceae bacterium]|nr:SprB repeat-containing protein [Cyclobacteriaceae bacterium]
MKTLQKLISVSCIILICLYTGCSSSEDPSPSDCTTSTLAVSVKTKINPSACGTNNGSIEVEASGGEAPYTFAIGSGSFSSTSVFQNLGGGTFSITAKDTKGCTKIVASTLSTGVTYTTDILPIFQAKCQFTGCHPTNGNWFDYTTAKSKASIIKTKTGDKSMPKNNGDGNGGPLSDEQIALIACWVDGGAPN